MKILLIIYSGNAREARKAIEKKFFGGEVGMASKNSLKSLTKAALLGFLRNERRDLTVIYCEDLEKEQLMPLKLLGIGANAKKKVIIDKKGRCLKIDSLRVLLIEFPIYLGLKGCLLAFISLINCALTMLDLAGKVEKKNTIIACERGRKVRIAYLRTDYEGDIPGGAMSHVSGFAKGIIDLGNEIFFISSSKIDGVEEKVAPCYIIGAVSFFNQIWVEASQIFYNFRFVFNAYKILKGNKADFLYHRSSTFNCSGAILSVLLKKALILEFNSSSLWKTDKYVRHRFRLTRLIMERFNLACADRVVVVSEVSKNQLEKRGIDVRKLVVNPNGADPETFNPGVRKKDLRSIHNLNNKMLVGFAGSLYQWHGLETLVGCVKKVTSRNSAVHFIIFGDGYLRNKLEEMAEKDGIANFITFTGLVAKEEMPAHLNVCDMLVSPHRNMADGQTFFGSPVKIFEYMAMGKPIVASEVGQLGEILQDGVNALLVPPNDPEKLGEAILKLASNPDLRESLGKKARRDLLAKYTWTHNAKRVIESLGG
jgi:glycosyltransferase involved in cell wall biosynthesis